MSIEARLQQAASLPEVLAASFDAFEAIRIAARDYEDRVPELFAAFLTTADAAVDGREAVTRTPSLPHANGIELIDLVTAGADSHQAADALAAIAGMLRDHLSQVAAQADTPDDRSACQDADAAQRIGQLLTR